MERLDHPGSIWFVLIYRTATQDTQDEIVLRLASSFRREDLTVLASSSRSGHFVIAECATERDQRAVDRIVMAVDRTAVHLHTATPDARYRQHVTSS